MKLNNKGFAISSIMYIILVFSLVLVVSILGLLNSRKMTLDKVKKTTLNEVKSNLNKKSYRVGDIVMVKGEEYRVIADSPKRQDYVTLLKTNPLTVDEVNTYGEVGTSNNHVNRYPINGLVNTSNNVSGYGGMAYYSSVDCGYVDKSVVRIGCTTNYEESDIKYVIGNWSQDKFPDNELKIVNSYSARLIQLLELEKIGYQRSGQNYPINNNIPNWLYNSSYDYWTMSPISNSSQVWWIDARGNIGPTTVSYEVFHSYKVLRPVINIYKSAIEEET